MREFNKPIKNKVSQPKALSVESGSSTESESDTESSSSDAPETETTQPVSFIKLSGLSMGRVKRRHRRS